VTRVYLCDSLVIDMTADDKARRCAGCVRTDQIGKVFMVVGQDVRKCLICEGVFSREASVEHAKLFCHGNAFFGEQR
jgi:hypothetical protein